MVSPQNFSHSSLVNNLVWLFGNVHSIFHGNSAIEIFSALHALQRRPQRSFARVVNKFDSGSALFLPKSYKKRLKKAPTNFFKKRHNFGQKRLKFDPPNNFYCIFMHKTFLNWTFFLNFIYIFFNYLLFNFFYVK